MVLQNISQAASNVFSLDFDFDHTKHIFALYIGGLFLLACFLSIFVAYLHIRKESVVYPLTRPQTGQYFCEYIIVVKTSLWPGSSFDPRGRVVAQLRGAIADSVPLYLRKGKGIEFFFTRGSLNIFVYHSPYDLGEIREVNIEMTNDVPYETPHVDWSPCFISVICPLKKEQWGTAVHTRLHCPDNESFTFQCFPEERDRNGILKSLCLFHMWLSMLNSPIRLGMFSNIVSAIMVYYVLSLIMFGVLLITVMDSINNNDQKHETFMSVAMVVCVIWIIEIILEALIRNTVPAFSCSKYAQFQGLQVPAPTPYLLRDFSINYNWDNVTPLLPRQRLITPRGSRHGHAQAIFNVIQPHTVYNLWGTLNLEEQREWSTFMRSMNACALPLPVTMRWLAKEAWGTKEDVLLKKLDSDFRSPVCYFCCWLQDWPLHYFEEPQQAGLIFSYIMSKDILTLCKMQNKEQQARFAQACLHQWHGLICGLFLFTVHEEIEMRNEAMSNIKAFMQRTVNRSKRSVREIQAGWKAREKVLVEVQQKNANKRDLLDMEPTEGEDKTMTDPKEEMWEMYVSDLNMDKNMNQNPQSIGGQLVNFVWQNLISKMPPFRKVVTKKSKSLAEISEALDTNYYKDELIFEDVFCSKNYSAPAKQCKEKSTKYTKCESGDWTDTEDQLQLNNLPACQIVQEEAKSSVKNVSTLFEKQFEQRKDLFQPQSTQQAPCEVVHVLKPKCGGMKTNSRLESNWKGNTNNSAEEDDMDKALEMDKLLKMKLNQKQKKRTETNKKLEALLQMKEERKQGGDTDAKTTMCMFLSSYEEVELGCPYDSKVARKKDPLDDKKYMRHRDEIVGYCCSDRKCLANADIHRKVGHSSLEILRRILTNLLFFAMDSRFGRLERKKCWLRKAMILNIFTTMKRLAVAYDDTMFSGSNELESNGFNCNRLLTSNFTILEVLLNVAYFNKELNKYVQTAQRIQKPMTDAAERVKRCVFCANILQFRDNDVNSGCYNEEKLVKFFSRDTISVAEKEINLELQSKFTVQNYCAMMVNLAKKELLNELEDPPSVLATKVTRAMIHVLLDEMIPKITDFKKMSADELRRMGTRRQRIQARNDPAAGLRHRESRADKRRKAIIQDYNNVVEAMEILFESRSKSDFTYKSLVEELDSRWRVNAKENCLINNAHLMAECLVQERLLGFAIYSGIISKEHEILLEGSRDRLAEVEEKAYKVILDIARKFLSPLLTATLDSVQETDVLFIKDRMEVNYLIEAINVTQVLNESTFLKTCCFYINNIAVSKVAEFQEFLSYMKTMDMKTELTTPPNLPLLKSKNQFPDEELQVKEAMNHSAVISPIHRWGIVAVKGVPPVPKDLKPADPDYDYGVLLPKVITVSAIIKWSLGQLNHLIPLLYIESHMQYYFILQNKPELESVVATILKTRRSVKKYLDDLDIDKSVKLQSHLARVQTKLTEQIATASESMSDAYVPEDDYLRDYLPEDLFDVEYFATGKMKAPLGTLLGIIIMILVFFSMLFAIGQTTIKASQLHFGDMKSWFLMSIVGMVIYGLILEPLKCLLYSLLRLYVD